MVSQLSVEQEFLFVWYGKIERPKWPFPNGCFIGFRNLPRSENKLEEKKHNEMELVFEYTIQYNVIFLYLQIGEKEIEKGKERGTKQASKDMVT